MFRLQPNREIRRDRQPRRLCLAGPHPARSRHHGGLRPAQERKCQRTRLGPSRARTGGHPIRPARPHAAVMDPVLNSALDRDAIARDFSRDRRVHIPSILTEESAARVHRCLAQETDFSLLCRTGGDQAQAWRVANLTPQKEAELMNAAYAGAGRGFHYLYDGHVLSRDGEAYREPTHTLSAITAFLNSTPLLDFARRVAGNAAIAFADAQATRYRPGHFLNQHDDGNDTGRIAAYVL